VTGVTPPDRLGGRRTQPLTRPPGPVAGFTTEF